ncbi:TPA: hypothetical protein JZ161_004242 [Escherichia coli]|nr:hypothetical protein [Salmonella enterica]EER4281636.1 hypothetical protein [Escherichia coli]EFP4171507.1 hypothetical protein [Shigella sonnei]HAY5296473.1 hypothetical protein [Shigella flexneri]HBT5994519.1 hypothetical protein [Klebsiella pneumoniae]
MFTGLPWPLNAGGRDLDFCAQPESTHSKASAIKRFILCTFWFSIKI